MFSKVLKSLYLIALLSIDQQSLAIDLDPSEIRTTKTNKKISVLQNRFFLKEMRPEIGIEVGTLINEAYTDTTLAGLSYSFYLSEWIGFTGYSLQASTADTEDRKVLQNLRYRSLDSDRIVSPDPEINLIRSINEAGVHFLPFYGKLNLIDQLIIYSDLYIGSGISMLETDQGKINGGYFSLGQKFYWKKNMSIKAEVKNRIFKESNFDKKVIREVYSVALGVSYFLF